MTTTTATVIEDVEFMLATGEHPARIIKRLDTTPWALAVRLNRAGKRDLARIIEREAKRGRCAA